MAVAKVLARNWILQIQNPNTLIYTSIGGINSFTFNGEKNDADTTCFDDAGDTTHLVASRSRKLGVEGFYLEDASTKDRDAGQVLIEELADAVGASSLGTFKLTSPAGTVRNFTASANMTNGGGANDDPSNWGFELNVSGSFNFAEVLDTEITVTPATLALSVGEISDVLTTVFTPANTTDKTLTYASSDETKAVVTAEGRVVGIAAGSATITVTSAESNTDTVAVTVS